MTRSAYRSDITSRQPHPQKLVAAFTTAAVAAAALLLGGCGAQQQTGDLSSDLAAELERIEQQGEGPVYWLGSSFEGLPLTHADHVPRPLLIYGECRGEGGGDSYHCTAPQIQLQHWPLESPSRYPREISCTRTTVRGVPAAQFDGFEVYAGRGLIKIYAPTQAQARRAAAALRPIDGSSSASEPLPQPAIDVEEPLRRCALDSLEAKLRELESRTQRPLYWVGERFEGMQLVGADGDGRWARFLYSKCQAPGDTGACRVLLTIEASPVDEVRPAEWEAVRDGIVRCTRDRIRGADAARLPSAGEVYVFTGATTVRLQGLDPKGLLRRAAEALHPLGGGAAVVELPPTPDDVRDELHRICRS